MAVRARGRVPIAIGAGLCNGSDRPDLIFWLLLNQAKSNSLSAAIERDDGVMKNTYAQK
jgi:hypothetical protein